MIRASKRNKLKERLETFKTFALLFMIAINIFEQHSAFESNFQRELAESSNDVVVDHLLTSSPKAIKQEYASYVPSHLETRIMASSRSELQYDRMRADECSLFFNTSQSGISPEYHEYVAMMDKYIKAVKNFDAKVDDLRLIPTEKRQKICQSMDNILKGAFPAENSLSRTRGGFIEPLLPPLRHPRFCEDGHLGWDSVYLLNIDYLVHDFGLMCNQLNSTSKTVFVDLGASLDYHPENNPALQLVDLYQKFGIKFDHYYAFEATVIPPDQVFQKVPRDILPSYHWFNVPVEVLETSKQNPWASILSKYNEDDLVVVKLDIDTPAAEIPLVGQLLEEKNSRIVDQFYFEHHVRMKNMLRFWKTGATKTLQHSMDLFTQLRQTGIAAHSWI
ncbi:unnamed protein product [Cylindrotheca closterium]|uniref:Uncharacterized protein n=1 Tax=Cylindrotheca closterium TaxID=2856 RepID=A0AAD2CSU8_9STRA|nr:unnamed protein product [Cylindrotheca closterium]